MSAGRQLLASLLPMCEYIVCGLLSQGGVPRLLMVQGHLEHKQDCARPLPRLPISLAAAHGAARVKHTTGKWLIRCPMHDPGCQVPGYAEGIAPSLSH